MNCDQDHFGEIRPRKPPVPAEAEKRQRNEQTASVKEIEDLQRERVKARFTGHTPSPSTADFDLPAASSWGEAP